MSTPTPVPSAPGTVRVVFGAMFDRDDAVTEYDVYRNNGATRIGTISRDDAEFWNLPKYSFTDSGLAVGSQVRYQVRARDAAGNFQWSAWSGYVTVSDATSPYGGTVTGHGATHLWRLGEAAGSTVAVDTVGGAHGTPNTGRDTWRFGSPAQRDRHRLDQHRVGLGRHHQQRSRTRLGLR